LFTPKDNEGRKCVEPYTFNFKQ